MRKRLTISLTLIVTALLIHPPVAEPFSLQEERLTKEGVRTNIAAGVNFLKNTQLKNGVWEFQGQFNPTEQAVGCTALCGIALMECDVSVTDKHVLAAASVIRTALNGRYNYNYGACLSLLFLDRLHRGSGKIDHGDAGTIKKLAQAIIAGQSTDGGWSYYLTPTGTSDNSNTQFAIVALWVARKYMPGPAITQALQRADKKFRTSQRPDGGWGYDATNIQVAMEANGPMTCAGILGLALNSGARGPSQAAFRGKDATGSMGDTYDFKPNDGQITIARAFLVRSFNEYLTSRNKHGHITYFFWSLERVATLLNWTRLDDARTIDWYSLGARFLIRMQQPDGSWKVDGLHGPAVDTAFALLFLSRSNLLTPEQDAVFTAGSLTQGAVTKKEEKKPQPPPNHDQTAKELAGKAIAGLANERQKVLEELRDAPIGKGSESYTLAMVDVIEKSTNKAAKDIAREYLAERLQRLSSEQSRSYLYDMNRELRLAAVASIRLKKDIDSAGELIPMLSDQDADVAAAAYQSLKTISEQDFGKSVERWSRWLKTVKKQ